MSATETEREAPRRLRAADVIDTLENTIRNVTARRDAEPYATVEFTRNAKGDTQVSVKVSAAAGHDAKALSDLTHAVYAEAKATYDDACRSYPAPEPAPPKSAAENNGAAARAAASRAAHAAAANAAKRARA